MNYRMNFALKLALACAAFGAFAGSNKVCFAASHIFQQGPGRGPITASRDPELEKQSIRSLEAASSTSTNVSQIRTTKTAGRASTKPSRDDCRRLSTLTLISVG